MTKEEIKEFSLKISQASRSQLVVVTYEIIIKYLFYAKEAMENQQPEEFIFNFKKAKGFVDNLISSLDLKYKVSYDLMSMYLFINKCLVKGIAKKESDKIDDLIAIINKLKSAFEEISKSDDSGPALKNSQKVYAGLTYGRNALNEHTL